MGAQVIASAVFLEVAVDLGGAMAVRLASLAASHHVPRLGFTRGREEGGREMNCGAEGGVGIRSPAYESGGQGNASAPPAFCGCSDRIPAAGMVRRTYQTPALSHYHPLQPSEGSDERGQARGGPRRERPGERGQAREARRERPGERGQAREARREGPGERGQAMRVEPSGSSSSSRRQASHSPAWWATCNGGRGRRCCFIAL